MTEISRASLFEALDAVIIPGTDISPVKHKGVKGIDIDEAGNVIVKLDVPAQAAGKEDQLKTAIAASLSKVSGVSSVTTAITVQDKAHGQVQQQNLLPGVRFPLLVGSGKGGVGKSTVTVNLSIALAAMGYKVGLMDGDLYGPSIPLMFGIHDQPYANDEGKIVPFERHGVKLISIGFLLEDDKPVVWRGPILHKAIQQFMKDVDWGELDFLLIDLPPGTGDVQLSVAQSARVSGAVAVSTPQDVALIDVKKAIHMFQMLQIPLLGVVENMSYFRCGNCEQVHHIFGGNRTNDTADKLSAPVLGKIPITVAIREGGDEGLPLMISQPESEAADIFRQVAAAIVKQVDP